MNTQTIERIEDVQPPLPRYKVTLLGAGVIPRDINNAGTIIGTHSAPTGELAFIMRYGVITYMGTLGGQFTTPERINSNGVIAGWTTTPTAQVPFIHEGYLRSLGSLGGGHGAATALNNLNQVVGYSETSDGQIHAFLYANGAMLDLGTMGTGTYSIARGINLRGQIVGEVAIEDSPLSPTRPFLYERGVMTDLGSFGGYSASAGAINDSGLIAGFSTDEEENAHLFLVEQGGMRDLGNFGGYITPRDMNNRGQIIGVADDRVSGFPFIYTNGLLVRLNELIDPALGWRIDGVFGINDRGQIVGGGCRGNLCGGVLLDPIA